MRRVRLVAIDEADTLLSGASGIDKEVKVVLGELGRRAHHQRPQHVLTAATLGEAGEAEVRATRPHLLRWFP